MTIRYKDYTGWSIEAASETLRALRDMVSRYSVFEGTDPYLRYKRRKRLVWALNRKIQWLGQGIDFQLITGAAPYIVSQLDGELRPRRRAAKRLESATKPSESA